MINPTDRCHECQQTRFEHQTIHGRLVCPTGGGTFYIPPSQAAGEEKPGGMNAWDKTIGDMLDWQRKQFPDATEQSSLKHLKKEIAEVELNIANGEETVGEWADVFFMVIQAADRNPRWKSLLAAIRAKLDVNRFEREWNEADKDGVFHHKTPEDMCDHERPRASCVLCNPTREPLVPTPMKGTVTTEPPREALDFTIDGHAYKILIREGDIVHAKEIYFWAGIDPREFDMFLVTPEEADQYLSPTFGTINAADGMQFYSVSKTLGG